MRYAEFRDRLEAALHEAGLFVASADWRVETIDLADTVRSWSVSVRRATRHDTQPFDVSAVMSFKWGPAHSARAYTTEEDLLTELVGRRKRTPRTERRWMRVDLSLHANLPYGSTTLLPETSVLGAWAAAVVEHVNAAFTDVEERDGRIIAISGGHGDLELGAQCNPDGLVSLNSVAITGFRIVRVPRVWDSPERRFSEADLQNEVSRLALTFRQALDDWTESISRLARHWVRCS